jgi:hypothetical protein
LQLFFLNAQRRRAVIALGTGAGFLLYLAEKIYALVTPALLNLFY